MRAQDKLLILQFNKGLRDIESHKVKTSPFVRGIPEQHNKNDNAKNGEGRFIMIFALLS